MFLPGFEIDLLKAVREQASARRDSRHHNSWSKVIASYFTSQMSDCAAGRDCATLRSGGCFRFDSAFHDDQISALCAADRQLVTCVTEDPMSPLPDWGIFEGPTELTSSVASECSVMPKRPTQAHSLLQSKDSPTRRAAGQPSFNFKVKFSWTSG